MKAFLILTITAVLYSIIRSKHDSYLREGKWKLWAMIEGLLVSVAISYSLATLWWMVIVMALVFWITFWILFDSLMGIVFGGSIFYLGETGWDGYLRAMFQYTEETKGIQLFFAKIIVAIIIYGTYFSCYNLYVK